ncbi:MAG: bifunctional [glutamate--ammonia ligase]-adenylyl-L-tyrosine phosphorylase/[glutamate--ammonia-ligase] adenylyltransferase [Desulfobacterales bacterium]|nr:bifunctional [glutamate--ammonia ligase]-adenylyl-L-tyrosine phosphorylase/[glutamate--ammonia-ligase] adenylyltransferase [Desulfobacterales bacterium]
MKITDNLPDTLAEDGRRKWDAFCRACGRAGVAPPEEPAVISDLIRVFCFSDFVARSFISHPEISKDLLASSDLQKKYGEGEYHSRIQKTIDKVKDESDLSGLLRRVRLREMLRIAWRDLSGRVDLLETMADLSNFADACLENVLAVVYPWQCAKHGVPVNSKGVPQRLVVLGMGKLGARELNFSSDIDLLFCFPEAGNTSGDRPGIRNEEFFIRLCRRLINVLGNTTVDGLLFRVDMRLRPFGESGPLVMNFDGMENYYQKHGREWERYAWIKTRVVAGDKFSGEHLLKMLQPFVYRRYLDFGVFESLRDMKEKIALEEKRRPFQDNIKLGVGGIREIEFFIQVFQLTRGGIVPALRDTGALVVLEALSKEKFISAAVRDELVAAYVFLRNSEHRLQEFADQQTHNLPESRDDRMRLAVSMGFEDWAGYMDCLEKHRKNVHGHFNALLVVKSSKTPEQAAGFEFDGIWLDAMEKSLAENVIASAGFNHPEEILGLLDRLRGDPATRALSRQGRKRLDQLIPLVLKEVSASEHPDMTLKRIFDLIKTIQRRTCYIALLLENASALTHMVKLADASPWIVSFLSRHPVLLDELLDPRSLYAPSTKDELRDKLHQRLAKVAADDLEYQLEELCIFKQTQTLHIAAADVSGALSLMRISDHLTWLAEVILEEVLDLSWDHLVKKHGRPACVPGGQPCDRGFAVIAYGKLGGIELGYDSDLDLVFLHAGTPGQTDNRDNAINMEQFFTRLGQRVIHILSTHSATGILYKTDMRLRPSGNSGLLVSPVGAFRDYQTTAAWTWEHQALVRARAIIGDPFLKLQFEQIRQKALSRPRNKKVLRQEIVDMRQRLREESAGSAPEVFDLKQDPGGIIDIEFLVQYLVLLNACQEKRLVRWTDNVRQLQSLAECGILDRETAAFLTDAYLAYRSASHRLSLQEKPARVSEKEFRDLRGKIIRIWSAHFLGG